MVQHGLRAAAFWAALSVLSSLVRELQNFSPARRSWACETASSANTLGHDQSTEPARLPQPSRAIGYMTAPISLWFSSKALIPSGMPSLSRGVHATSCISSPVWMPRAGKYKRAAVGSALLPAVAPNSFLYSNNLLKDTSTMSWEQGKARFLVFTRRMGCSKGQVESLPYITVTQQYQHPAQLNVPCSIWSNSQFLRLHH